jgi:Tfp pilus assembly protein PilN
LVVGSCQMREGRVAALDEAIAEIAPLRPQLEHLEETLNVLENYKTEQFSWLEILAELNEILPKEAMLTQLTMERSGKVMMQGTIGGETPAQKIEPFTTALKNSKFFAEAESGPIRRRKSDWSFSVACTLSSAKKGK